MNFAKSQTPTYQAILTQAIRASEGQLKSRKNPVVFCFFAAKGTLLKTKNASVWHSMRAARETWKSQRK